MSSRVDEAAPAANGPTSSSATITAARTAPSPALASRCMFLVLPQRVRDRIYDLLFDDNGSAPEGAIVRVNRLIRSETRSRYRIASTAHRLEVAVLRKVSPRLPMGLSENSKRQELEWATGEDADEEWLFEG